MREIIFSPYFFLFLVSLVVLLVGAAALYFVHGTLKKKQTLPTRFRMAFFSVLLPKSANLEDRPETNTPQNIRNACAIAEQLFAAIGGLKAQRGLKKNIVGRDDHLSFEIVAQNGVISLYLAVPKFLKNYIHEMILAQYPQAVLEEVRPYNLFSPFSKTRGCYLTLTKPYIFPLKTYTEMDTDSLNPITHALSKITHDNSAVIQYIFRSAKKEWHAWGYKAAQDLQKGKTIKQAVHTNAPGVTSAKVVNFFSSGKTQKKKDKENEMSQSAHITPMMQETIKKLEEKTSKAGLDVNIRIITSCQTEASAQSTLRDIIESFNQFNSYQYGNTIGADIAPLNTLIRSYLLREYQPKYGMVLNTAEAASVFHFPTPYTETPNLKLLLAKKLPAPVNIPASGFLLGKNIYQGVTSPIHIKTEDRRRHMYLIGMTGTGKSTLLENLAIQDIRAGHGVCVVDPHGTLVENILRAVPKERAEDVIVFNASDIDRPMGLNILEAKSPQEQDLAIQEMIAIFYKLVTDPSMIGPMFEHNMRNAMLTLMADPKHPGTIVDIPRIFTDPEFQKYKLKFVTDPLVRNFWEKEMAKTSDFHKSEMLGYLISKVGRFVENALVRNIIGQEHSSFDFREIMDHKKVLLVNLSKGKIGEMNSSLLGLILVSKIQMAALARADVPESQRSDFYLYLDEFQNFITDSISVILAEARKYRLNLIMAHQYLGQLTAGAGVEGKSGNTKVRDAIFGNVGTIIAFRIGIDDAEIISKQLAPDVTLYDLMNIEKFYAYVRLLVDNQATKTFNMQCFPPIQGDERISRAIQSLSRLKHGRPVSFVEREILENLKLGNPPKTMPMEKRV